MADPDWETSLTTCRRLVLSRPVTMGITSYIGLHDLLARMLQVRILQSHEPIGQKAFPPRRESSPRAGVQSCGDGVANVTCELS
jgi:hypothetical protein